MKTGANITPNWAPPGTVSYPAADGWTELVLHDLNIHNDNLSVYYKMLPDGRYQFSDGSQTLRELQMLGKQATHEDIDRILTENSVLIDKDDLILKVPAANREEAFRHLLTTMKSLLTITPLSN